MALIKIVMAEIEERVAPAPSVMVAATTRSMMVAATTRSAVAVQRVKAGLVRTVLIMTLMDF
jgi:hypothetical protein